MIELHPDWPAPTQVFALCTTRQGGVSRAPYDSLNVATHVDDTAEAVAENRARLAAALPSGSKISWLEQVHGAEVLEAAQCSAPAAADAMFTRAAGEVCAVLSADCLPVLFCSIRGNEVAAAHAGWRGLASGVLEATLAALQTPAAELLVWLGPAIGPGAFEVGPEVREAFVGVTGEQNLAAQACFRPSLERPGHFFADLYGLARIRLTTCGVTRVFGGEYCTYSDPDQFFSYRRDGVTGRMASLIGFTD